MVNVGWLGIKLFSAGFKRVSGVTGCYELFEKDQPGGGVYKLFLVDQTEKRPIPSQVCKDLAWERKRAGMSDVICPVLFLVLTTDTESSKALCNKEGFNPYWLVDATASRLMIFEDAPEDFCGLNRILSSALQSRSEPEENDPVPLRAVEAPPVSWEFQPQPERIYQDPPVKPLKKKKKTFRTKTIDPSEGTFLSNYVLKINFLLILINLGVYAVNLMLVFLDPDTSPYLGALHVTDLYVPKYYFHFLTAAFVHFSVEHIGGNMICLFFMGPVLEAALGKVKYVFTYLVSGVLANVFSVLIYLAMGRTNVVTAGASGAVFAVLGGIMAAMMMKRIRINGSSTTRMVLAGLYMLVSGFFSKTGVNNSAHVVGMLFGFVISFLIFAGQDFLSNILSNRRK